MTRRKIFIEKVERADNVANCWQSKKVDTSFTLTAIIFDLGGPRCSKFFICYVSGRSKAFVVLYCFYNQYLRVVQDCALYLVGTHA